MGAGQPGDPGLLQGFETAGQGLANAAEGGGGGLNPLGFLGPFLGGLAGVGTYAGTQGQSTTGGAVAPQSYNYGPFGLFQKNIPGLTAQAPVAPISPVGFSQPNFPQNVQSTAPTLVPMQQTQAPAYRPVQPATVEPASSPYAPVAQAGIAPAAPAGSPVALAAAEEGAAPSDQNVGGAPSAPLQGEVSEEAPFQEPVYGAPQAQSPWAAQAQSLMQGASNFFQPMFNGLGQWLAPPAEAANQGSPAPMMHKPPEAVALAPEQLARMDYGNGNVLNYGQFPSEQQMQQLEKAAQVRQQQMQARFQQNADQIAKQFGSQVGGPDYVGQTVSLLKDLEQQRTQLRGGLQTLADHMRQEYKDAADQKFNTKIEGLGGMTLNQYHDYLQGQVATMNSKLGALQNPTSQEFEAAVDHEMRSIEPQYQSVAGFVRGMSQGPFAFMHPGFNRSAEAMARGAENPERLRAVAEDKVRARYAAAAKAVMNNQDQLGKQMARIDAEKAAADKHQDDVEARIVKTSMDALSAFNTEANGKLEALAKAGNMQAQQAMLQLANDRAQLQQLQTQLQIDQAGFTNTLNMAKIHNDQRIEIKKLEQQSQIEGGKSEQAMANAKLQSSIAVKDQQLKILTEERELDKELVAIQKNIQTEKLMGHDTKFLEEMRDHAQRRLASLEQQPAAQTQEATTPPAAPPPVAPKIANTGVQK